MMTTFVAFFAASPRGAWLAVYFSGPIRTRLASAFNRHFLRRRLKARCLQRARFVALAKRCATKQSRPLPPLRPIRAERGLAPGLQIKAAALGRLKQLNTRARAQPAGELKFRSCQASLAIESFIHSFVRSFVRPAARPDARPLAEPTAPACKAARACRR